jgi:hypothetical protein
MRLENYRDAQIDILMVQADYRNIDSSRWPAVVLSVRDSYDVPQFNGVIEITASGNDDFLKFVESQVGAIIYLDAIVDACVATQEQHEVIKREGIDMSRVVKAQIGETTYPLLSSRKEIAFIRFSLLPNRNLYPSFGGTGTIQIPITGFFMISASAHGGPSRIFHLSEQDAPLEARLHRASRLKKK